MQGDTSTVYSVDSAMAEQSAFEKNLRIMANPWPSSPVGSAIRNLWNKWTGSGLTDAQKIQNQINIEEAEKSRVWQENMANTQYQRGVVDMQKAGINPALALTSGASPAPTPSGATATAAAQDNGVGFGELVNSLLLPLQVKQLKANIDNVVADTAKKNVEAAGQRLQNDYQGLVNKYYPQLTEETIAKIHADVGVSVTDAALKAAQTELTKVDKVIRIAEADKASELVEARLELQKAQSEAARKAAIASAAKALVDGYEAQYMKSHNARMSSSAVVALAEAIASWSGLDSGEGVSGIVTAVEEAVGKSGKTIVNDLEETMSQRAEDRKYVGQNLKNEIDDYKRGFQNMIKRSRERWNKWNGKNVR